MAEVWFVTGATSGFGREVTINLLEKTSCCVVATGRKLDPIKDLLDKHQRTAFGIVVDVTKQSDVNNAVDLAIKRFGKIDVLLNSAGFNTISTPNEMIGEKNARDVFEVNYFGLQRMINSVLPHMRKRKTGHIINMCSIAGFRAGAMLGAYSASKHAVLGLSESYKEELAPLGIRVSVIAPSEFRTRFGEQRTPLREEVRLTEEFRDYEPMIKKTVQLGESLKTSPGNPILAAEAIVGVHLDRESPFRCFVGKRSVLSSQVRGKEIIEDSVAFEKKGVACDDRDIIVGMGASLDALAGAVGAGAELDEKKGKE